MTSYPEVLITKEHARRIAKEFYGISGKVFALPGEIDFNFRIASGNKCYLLKIGRPDAKQDYLAFQQAILLHVAGSESGIISPVPVPDLQGRYISETKDNAGNIRKVRLLNWVEGRLWSGVNPVGEGLLYSLGEEAGRLTSAMQGFFHPLAESKNRRAVHYV